jgi:hypothetical protein
MMVFTFGVIFRLFLSSCVLVYLGNTSLSSAGEGGRKERLCGGEVLYLSVCLKTK